MTKVLVKLSDLPSDNYIKSTLIEQFKVKNQNEIVMQNLLSHGNEFCSQQDIFDEIGMSCIDKIIKGSNEIIIALGQKHSGKTNTLFGNNSNDKGLVQMMIQSLKHRGYESSLSCYQIFNEQIFDLLKKNPNKTIQTSKVNNELNIIDLSQTKLTLNQNVEQLLTDALKNRKSVKSNLHNQLDKSILIVTINVKHQNLKNNKITFVKLSVQKQDKSTDSFIKMIQSFGSNFNQKQSKFTQIIGYQMQNNSGINVIVHVSPEKKYQKETLFTLNIVNKIKSLEINQNNNNRYTKSKNENNKMVSNSQLQRMIKHQTHLKNIIMLYQNRCQIQKSQSILFQKQKKLFQQMTSQYSTFFKNYPTFSQILSQNIYLKQQLTKQINYPFISNKTTPTTNSVSSFDNSNSSDLLQIINKQNKIIQQYQLIISNFKQQFLPKLSQLSLHYSQLQRKQNTNTIKIQPKPSIRNFINQDEEIDILRTEIQLLKQQNYQLRSKNKQLQIMRQKQGLTLLELDHIKTKLVQIQSSMMKDQQNIRNGYIEQIQKVKCLYSERGEQQQNVTLKKFNISIKPSHKNNDTSQTFFLTETNRNIPAQNNNNKYRISISKSIDDNDRLQTTHALSNSHRIQDISILQSSQMRSQRSYYNSTQKMIKPQKKQRSQLQRLRLLLLKSKQKTQRTKITSQESSIKNCINNIIYSKSSIFQRTEYSKLSSKYKNKPKISVEITNKTESHKIKDSLSSRLRKNEYKYY